jgi:integrase
MGQFTRKVNWEGKPERVTVYADSQAACAEKMRRKRLEEAPAAGDLVTLRSAAGLWIASLRGHVEAVTLDHYQQDVKPLLRRLGDAELSKVGSLDVLRAYEWMAAEGYSAGQMHRAGKRLRQLWKCCLKLKLAAADPVATVKTPPAPKPEINPLSRAQAAQLLDAARGLRLEALYRLALDSGARQGELWALTPEDLEGDEIVINRSLTQRNGRYRVKTTKTPAGRRRVPLTPGTLCLLRALPMAPGKPLFGSAARGTWMHASAFYQHHWQPLLKRAKLEGFRFHDLRHTCATLLLLANVHPKVVSERLGHASIEVTLNTYSHLMPTMQASATGVLAEMLPEVEGAEQHARPTREELRKYARAMASLLPGGQEGPIAVQQQ